MNFKFTRSLPVLVFILAMSFFQKANATHIMGSDISYRCLGGNNYQVVVTVYRDCSGVQPATSILVDVTSACGTNTLTCDTVPEFSGLEVSQLCPSVSSTCAGGSLPGVQMWTYVGNITIQPGCGLYTFSYTDCCRNTSNNLVDPAPPSLGFGVQATLNSNLVNCDDAPTFTSLPVPYFCLNQTVNYSHGAVDTDGDSLVYTLTTPLDDLGGMQTYQGGFTATSPMPTSGGFGFDPLSGQMTFIPTQQGVYVVDVLVSEYRNGVLIGTTMRDIQIVIINCNNNAPVVANGLSLSNVTGGAIIDGNSLGVCPGSTISFTITGYDPDGQPVTVSSNLGASIPGATLVTTAIGGTDSVQVVFTWTPTGLDTGFRYFTVQFEDDACPITGLQLFTYDITVLDGTDAGHDQHYCTAGGPVQVTVYGGNHFSWTPTSGMVSANADSSIVYFAPTDTTTYYIESDLQGGCKTRDTIVVFLVHSFTSSISATDDTICLNSTTTLTVLAAPTAEAPFTYLWGPAYGGIQSPNTPTTDVRPGGTTSYIVTITSAAGCIIRDTLKVVIEGIGPKVAILTSANYVCPGTPITLSASVSALSCGPVPDPADPCLPNSSFNLQDLGTGLAPGTYGITPYAGAYADERMQFIYRASELQALGLKAGAITDLAFNVSQKASTQPYKNFSIKMGCTSLSFLPATYTPGLNTVLVPQTYSSTAGWNTHTLDTAFNWDGFSSLMVEVCYDGITSSSAYDAVYYTPTSYLNSVLWGAANFATASGCTSMTFPTQSQNRPNTRFVVCQAPTDNYSFTWTGSDGSILADTSTPSLVLNHDVIYTLIVSDGICSGDTAISLFVDSSVIISAGNDTVICNSQSVQLNASLLHPAVPYCVPGYNITVIPYAAIAPTGAIGAGPNQDDAVSNSIAMPFPFQFYCTAVTQYLISSNGFISFSPGQGAGCCSGQNLPNIATPNNLVALCWEDLAPNLAGTIDYFVSGVTPNRVAVIRWNNVSYYSGGGNVTGEIHLYENGNIIETHLSQQNNPGQINTLGVEDATGVNATVPPGYNAAPWVVTSPLAFRFTPQSAGNALSGLVWSPNYNLSSNTISNPIASPDTTISYVVTANFTSGCVTHDTVRVSIGSFPYSLNAIPDTICGGDSAQLMFNGNGVSYLWSPASVSSTTAQNPYAHPSTTTTYYVIASDSVGCGVSDSLVINVRSHSPIILGNDTLICPTDSVWLSPSGGPYTSYLWSTGQNVSTISTGNQSQNAQTYFVRVNDGTCFYNSDTINVSKVVLSQIVVQPSGDTAVCVGDSIHLSGDGGYQSYLWSNGQTSQVVTIDVAGFYTYTAIDTHGCILQAQDTAFVVAVQHPSAAIIANPATICIGQTTALLFVNADSGIVHVWNPGNIFADTLVVNNAGTYYLLANNNGCSSLDSVDVAAVIPPVIDLGTDQNLCSCDTLVTLSSDITASHYAWSTADSTQSINITHQGNYALTVTDANGCVAKDSVFVAIHCLTVDAFVADPVTAQVFAGQNAVLDVNSSYASTFAYMWTPGIYLTDSTFKQAHVSRPQATTTYWVAVMDITNGCLAYDSVVLTVIPPGVPPMPNAFSPNGDGHNDTYGPYISPALQGVYTIVSMTIYNRWGQLVFSSNTPWDGTFNGVLQPADTYVYYITMEGPDQNNPSVMVQYTYTGSFSLLH